ncbi:TAP42-like protein [Hesseltinella vesiculosa]|uniref:TAP42-like protein n=1 Tax=Hesseltinella vesiculosa TaxID=101127 RepID=A0A1X2G2C4_9FUNG|nr:TAP42-like protein [Hesseltinella vesiculosa]
MDTKLSLGELFTKGQELVTFLEETPLSSTDQEYQAKVQQALQYLETAQHLVERTAMFSTNELIDDVAPSDLKFLLTSAYLGQVMLKSTKGDRAATHFQDFLSICQDHQLLKKEDAQYFEQQSLDKKVTVSAAEQRQAKIARYRREKALKENIHQLRAQLDDQTQDQRDDELEREWVLALIDMEVLRSLEQMHGIEQEIVMVQEMEKMKLDRQRTASSSASAAASGSDYDESRLDQVPWTQRRGGPLLSKEGRPLQPFVITNQRQRIKDQVFRPGWALPTMTIDEYLDQERERGNIIEGGGEEPKKKEIDDNDYEAQDAETMKKREWDEFVEANPRGWGNRGNKG